MGTSKLLVIHCQGVVVIVFKHEQEARLRVRFSCVDSVGGWFGSRCLLSSSNVSGSVPVAQGDMNVGRSAGRIAVGCIFQSLVPRLRPVLSPLPLFVFRHRAVL